MRRKQQIQAMQQELALLRQTVDSGKELAALAAGAAQQLKKPNLKAIAVQVMKTPRFRRAALIAGGAAAVGTIGAAAARYRFYQTIVAQEVKRRSSLCTTSSTTCRRPWTLWPRPRASSRKRPARGKSTAAEAEIRQENAPPAQAGGAFLARSKKITGSLYGDPVIGTP